MFCFNTDKLEQFLCIIKTSNPLSPNKNHFHKIALMSFSTGSSSLKACTAKAKLTSELSLTDFNYWSCTPSLPLTLSSQGSAHANKAGPWGSRHRMQSKAPSTFSSCYAAHTMSIAARRVRAGLWEVLQIPRKFSRTESSVSCRVLSTLQQSLSGGTMQWTRNPR